MSTRTPSAKRLGDELGLSIYCYENAALSEERRNLATVRAGEYEGLEAKLKPTRDWKPDFGPAAFNARSGATAVSARDFLVAYNINLNTTSTRRANAIAFDVREQGRVKTDDGTLTGETRCSTSDGEKVRIPGHAQVRQGHRLVHRGVRRGADLDEPDEHVGDAGPCRLRRGLPLRRRARRPRDRIGAGRPRAACSPSSTRAAIFCASSSGRSAVSDRELIKIAIKSMGLDELSPFDPDEKIIEYAIAGKSGRRLVDLTLQGFAEETASESPAPGGGSVAAAIGALGAALGTMVANLSSHKRGWDERWEEFSDWADKGKACQDELVRLVDADTDAFNGILAAFRLPKGTDAEQAARAEAIEAANRVAIEVPLRVMEVASESLAVIRAMAADGMEQSASDAGVGALCARTAVMGAGLNVKTNVSGLKDEAAGAAYRRRAEEMIERANAAEAEILALVEGRFSGD